MDDNLGAGFVEKVINRPGIRQIADKEGDIFAGDFFKFGDSAVERRYFKEGVGTEFHFPLSLEKSIHNGDIMALLGEVHRRRPAQITVSA